MNRSVFASAIAALLLVAARPAYAQGYEPPAYPPPPSPPPLGGHTHDGFYLRLALGLGYLDDAISPSGATSESLYGGGLSGEILLGGTASPGLIVGGGVSALSVASPKHKVAGVVNDTSSKLAVSSTIVGPFLDYYFNPHGGFHLQGMVGLGQIRSTFDNGTVRYSGASDVGLGLAAGLGNEWWVSDNWGIGVLGKIEYVGAKDTENGASADHGATAISINFSATYN